MIDTLRSMRGTSMLRATKSTCTSHEKSAELCAGNVFGPKLGSDLAQSVRDTEDNLQDRKVWKIMHKGAHVCLSATMVFPLLVQRLSVLAVDFHRSEKLLDLKARS